MKGTLLRKAANLGLLFLAFAINLRGESENEQHLAKFFEHIENSEYEIKRSEEGVTKAANRAQNLRFTLGSDVLSMEPRTVGKNQPLPWSVSIKFVGTSKGGRPVPFQEDQRTIQGAKAHISSAYVRIEYENSKQGLRQNFRVWKQPQGNQPLTLAFAIESDQLGFEVSPNTVTFLDGKGESTLSYCDLNVWDANERKLLAAMVPNGNDGFNIVVDDSEAAYPIFVDPLVLQNGFTTTLASPSGVQYGACVRGYNDYQLSMISIGAPNYDTGFYTDAGKVFVFIKTSSWSSTPIWTKEGGSSYEYFGFSIACDRDFNGDGIVDYAIAAC